MSAEPVGLADGKLYRSGADAAEARRAFESGSVPVAVYGLGKMGLPLAAVYADVSRNVTGVDVDPDVVDRIEAGGSHVEGEPGLDELVAETVGDGALGATTDATAAAGEAAVHVIIVPTLIEDDGQPDLSAVDAVTDAVAEGLEPGDLVIVESTVPPRTCEDHVLPRLEAASGLELGEFGLAFCPERTKSGRAIQDVRGAHPKVVGGADDASTRAARLIYESIAGDDVVAVSDATTAEAVKVFEGVYRDVNIALANELGRFASELEIDVTEAIDAANTQPVCDIHTPGAGVGGHCIPIYPHFLIGPYETETSVMEAARAVNEAMPAYTAGQVLRGLREEGVEPAGAGVLVLGLTYRPGVDELRKTPSLPLIRTLADAGVSVSAVDPVTDDTDQFEEAGATIVGLDAVRGTARRADADDGAATPDDGYDAVVLVTPQPAFEEIDVPSLGTGDAPLVVVDGRQALTHLQDHDDLHYRGIGIDA